MTAPTGDRSRPTTRHDRPRRGGMDVLTQSIVVTLLGGLLVSITVSGRFTSYVRPGFRWLLLASGAILLVVGLLSLFLAVRADLRAGRQDDAAADDHQPDDGHGHDHTSSKAPWLILAPVLVLLLVAPPALGADAIARNAGLQGVAGVAGTTATAGSADDSADSRRTMHFDPLTGADPQIGLKEFVLRALYDADRSLEHGTPVTVVGFIAPAGDGFDSGYTIARMSISCCAADANPLQLHVDGDAPAATDTWVRAVVVDVPNTATLDNDNVPTVTVNSLQTVDQPDDPYEH